MEKRISVLFLLSLFILFVLASAALGAVDAKQGKRPIAVNRVDGAQAPSPYAGRSPVMYEGAKVSVCTDINPEVPVTTVASTGKGKEGATSGLLGQVGVAVTPLRPTGRAEFDERLLDVVTEGDFLEKGTPLEIIEVRGRQVVVRPYRGA